jgi:hypothetical protein
VPTSIFQHVPNPPLLFIMGLHRSGTTLLYQMLQASGQFNVLTGRHVVAYERYRYLPEPGSPDDETVDHIYQELADKTRVMDKVPAHPDTPEEYGFILNQFATPPHLCRRNVSLFLRVCHDLQRSFGNDRPVLLKNPWDFGRGHLIAEWLPQARFVYIHRNPIETLSSQYRFTYHVMTKRHELFALLSEPYRLLSDEPFPAAVTRKLALLFPRTVARVVIYHAWRSAALYLRTRRLVPADRCIDIRFDELTAKPQECLERILNFHNYEVGDIDYAGMIGTTHGQIDPHVHYLQDYALRRFRPYINHVGWDPEELRVK